MVSHRVDVVVATHSCGPALPRGPRPLIERQTDYDAARRDFPWPELDEFNWALDWFDAIAAEQRRPAGAVDRRGGRHRAARARFAEMARAVRPGGELAARARACGAATGSADARQPGRAVGDDAGRDEARRGDHPGHARCCGRPTSPTASSAAAPGTWSSQRRRRRQVRRRRRATTPASRSATPADGWLDYADAADAARRRSRPDGADAGDRPAAALLHLRHHRASPSWSSTPRSPTRSATCRRCTGSACEPGDVHLNISSPGWAKHAWSNFFAPWNAEATRVHLQLQPLRRRRAAGRRSTRCGVTTFCAPPTVWRMLIQADLTAAGGRRCARSSAPASRSTPRSSSRSQRAWGLTIRDGFGQTETTVADRQHARASRSSRARWAARCPGYRDRAGRPGDRRAVRRRGRDLPRPRAGARSA